MQYLNNIFENIIEKRYFIFLIIFGFATIYAVFGYQHKIGNYGVETDFLGLYGLDAERILNGEMVQERDHAPGYSLLVASLGLIFGDIFTAGKILSILAAFGCLWIFYKLILTVFDNLTSLLTLLLFGIYLLPYSFIVGLDVVFTFFFLWGIYLFFRADYTNNRFLIFSGLVSGLAFLVRYNGVILPLGIFLIFFILNPEKTNIKGRISQYLYYIIPFVILISPWLLFTTFAEGGVSSPGLNVAIAWEFYGDGTFFGGDERKLVDPKLNSLFAIVFHDFRQFSFHYIENVVVRFKQLSTSGLHFPAYFFIAPGILITFNNFSLKQLSLFMFPLLGYLILCLVNYLTRYFLFIFPFFVLLVVLFFMIQLPVNSRFRWLSFKYIKWIVLLFIFVFTFNKSYKTAYSEIKSEPRYLLEISEKLKKRANQSDKIMSRKPHLAYLSNLQFEHFPQVDSLSTLTEIAKENDCKFIFYGKIEQKLRPQFNNLTKPETVSQFLDLVCSNEEEKIYLYSVKKYYGGKK